MKQFIYIALLSALLSGCASKQPQKVQSLAPPQASAWNQQVTDISALTTWEAQGRIAASHEGEGGSASFLWEQAPQFYKIRMYGPFGAGSAELTGSPKQVIFEENDGKRAFAKTPDELVFRQTGLTIPVRGLTNWIKGIPSDAYTIDHITWNTQGRLVHLIQSGWEIEYLDYALQNGFWLPTRLNLNRDQIKIKLIVKKWQV